MARSGPKIGIFGGTFDPPHLGHLRVAEEVRESFPLEEIWFIPAGSPPHKERAYLPFTERLHLIELSIRENPYFKVLDIEREEKPSYTLKTLEKLSNLYRDKDFYLLLGWDAFMEMETWWNYQEFLHFASLIVFSRGKGNWNEASRVVDERAKRIWGPKAQGKVFFIEVFPMEISSTTIRKLLLEGRSIRYLVPEAVYFYLREKRLTSL